MVSQNSNSDSTEVAPGGKLPPQNLDAEKSLLGAILISDSSFPDILERVKERDFYDQNHSLIYKAMATLYSSHRPIDILTLTSELRAEKTFKKVGGGSYLTELTNFVPTAANASAYADIIADCATRRRLIDTGIKITEKAYDSSNSTIELIGDAEKILYSVSDTTTKTSYISLEKLSIETYERLEALKNSKEKITGLKTGFKDLDTITAGLQKGDLVIIGARPAMGKTTLAQNIAYNAATINHTGVLFFSMEMAANEISDRIVSDIAEIDNWSIRSGNLTEDDYVKIDEALSEMSEVPLYIDDTSMMNVLELCNKARRAAHEHDIGLVIIDYLQLISGTDRYSGNRVLEIAEISKGLKQLARELSIPVIALSQLSRGVTGRDDPRPALSDLRDSGSIEQDADLVMMLHRPDYYHQNEEDYVPTNITELLIQKHRHGDVGKIELFFQGKYSRFMSLDKTRK